MVQVDIAALRSIEREKEIPFEHLVDALETALLTAYKHTPHSMPHARVAIDRKTGDVDRLGPGVRPDGEIVEEYDDTPDRLRPGRGHDRAAGHPAAAARRRARPDLRGVLRPRGRHRHRRRPGRRPGRPARPRDRRHRQDRGDPAAVRAGARGSSTPTARRISAYVVGVSRGMRGPQVTLSRTHPNLVRKLFALEVPEIADGSVEIVGVAREAGHRTKIAVRTDVAGLNAKGACIGPMGQRVRNVVAELHGEKIDIIDWAEDPATYVGNALSPAHALESDVVDPGPWPSASSSRTSSCRWRSAARGRTPASPPGSPATASTSTATPSPTRPDAAPEPEPSRVAPTRRRRAGRGPVTDARTVAAAPGERSPMPGE